MSTIKDIARIAGVSTSTVSHVVNGTRNVSSELQNRVVKAIESVDRPPNFVVKKQAKDAKMRSYTLNPILISDRCSSFQQTVYDRLLERVSPEDMAFVRLDYKDVKTSAYTLDLLVKCGHIGGIIAMSEGEHCICYEMLDGLDVPVIIIGKPEDSFKADYITSDTMEGAYNAARHLIRSGHCRIAFLSKQAADNTRRFAGYREALADYGVDFDPALVKTGLDTHSGIVEALNDLFFHENGPSAAVIANYSLALPVFRFLKHNNINCPEDVSVICFNDFEWAALHTPPITIVDQNAHSVADHAFDLLKRRLAERKAGIDAAYETTVIPTTLKVRESVSGIAHGPFGEKANRLDDLYLYAEDLETLKDGKYKAVICFHYSGTAWIDQTIKGINSVFSKAGISLISINDAGFDPELQSKQLESVGILDPDIVIAMPVDNTQTAEAFGRIAGSRAKLILLTNIPDGLTNKDYVSCVSVNEHAHGRGIGVGLGEYMMDKGLVDYGMLKHKANFYATAQRDQAAEQVLTEEYPSLRLAGIEAFTRESDAYDSTVRLIRAHPEIQALYVPWEGPANEAMRAMSDLDRMDIAISTGDLDTDSALMMANAGPIKALSAQKPYEQGMACALAACGALLGRAVPKFIAVDPIQVTAINLNKAWRQVFREDCPDEIRDALRHNPQYIRE